jgi:2-methylfumaryl-CoA isomerase
VSEWFGRHTLDEVRAALGATRLLWSPYRTFGDLVADDAALLRGHPMFAPVDQPGVGRVIAPGSPVAVDRERGAPAPAPRVGEHTADVLRRALGLDPAAITDLVARGVVAADSSDRKPEVA